MEIATSFHCPSAPSLANLQWGGRLWLPTMKLGVPDETITHWPTGGFSYAASFHTTRMGLFRSDILHPAFLRPCRIIRFHTLCPIPGHKPPGNRIKQPFPFPARIQAFHHEAMGVRCRRARGNDHSFTHRRQLFFHRFPCAKSRMVNRFHRIGGAVLEVLEFTCLFHVFSLNHYHSTSYFVLCVYHVILV